MHRLKDEKVKNEEKRMKKKKTEGGFIAITSVLIIGAVVLVLGVSLFHSALTDYSISSAYESGQTASFLADFCLKEGLLRLKENIDYMGPEDIKVDDATCSISLVENVDDNTKKVSSFGRAGDQPHFSRSSQLIRYIIEPEKNDWENNEELINLQIVDIDNSLTLIPSEEIGITRTTDSSDSWYSSSSAENVSVENGDLVLEDNYTEGYRISLPLPLDEIKNVAESKIEWEATTPEFTSTTIKTVVTTDGENPPALDSEEWQTAVSGESIPGIDPGEDLTGQYLWTRQILETDDPATTPQLHSLTETILMRGIEVAGYRISPGLDISGPYTVKDSQIFWQADERSNGTISVKIRVLHDNGDSWEDWETVETVANGESIPGLERGTDLSQVKIQTKTSFVGGPDFYPILENIKIFIELE